MSAVFPAKVGIRWLASKLSKMIWVPACAGNTEDKKTRPSPNPLPQGEGLSVLALAPLGERVG